MTTAAPYRILFTDRFDKDLRRGWPSQVLARIDALIRAIAEDPFQPRGGVKKMLGKENAYRLRVRKWRLEYSLEPGRNELCVERLTTRGQSYSKGASTTRKAIAGKEKTQRILKRLRAADSKKPAPKSPPKDDKAPARDHEEVIEPTLKLDEVDLVEAFSEADVEAALKPAAEIETHPFISPAELLAEMLDDPKIDWLLEQHGVSQDIKQALHNCETEADFEAVPLPDSLREGLEELMTGNEEDGSDIERIYRLGDSDFGTLAARPLKSFLLHLDQAQQELVDKPLEKGPYLIRGAAGTGKTLVCLYRLRRMLIERTHQSFFDASGPRYAFLSYTYALVQAAKDLYEAIVADLDLTDVTVEFRTIDSPISDLRREHSKTGRDPIPPPFGRDERQRPFEMLERLISEHPQQQTIRRSWSADFFIDEFDQILYGNALDSLEDYLSFKRKGRKTRLGDRQKTLVWDLFEKFHTACLQEGKLTFDGVRREVLRRMEAGEFSPGRPYTYIFVDEVQDVPPTALRIFREFVPAKEALTLASDSGQSIYRRAPSWSSAHPDLNFTKATSLELQKSYRMSRQIQDAIAPLRVQQPESSTPAAVFSGPPPGFLWCQPDRMAETTVDLVQRIRSEIGASYGGIAIALRTNPRAGNTFLDALEGAEIPFTVFGSAHRNLELDSDKVHVLTAHSIKGLEFPHVIIPEVSGRTYPLQHVTRKAMSDRERQEAIEGDRRLLYVACSRAMHTLWLLADRNHRSPFVEELDLLLWEVEEIPG